MSKYLIDVYNRSKLNIVRGEGVYLYDDSGKEYLDFIAGIATVSLGHSHPYLVEGVRKQSEKLWHCSNLFTIPEQERLAERLVLLTFADQIFFCSSGLEATEAAIKMIRRYQYIIGERQRQNIIVIKAGFHGRSIAAISAGGGKGAKEGYGPLLPGFIEVERNDIDAITETINEQTAGVFLELVQSEGGVYQLDIEYLRIIRETTHQKGALLAFDEVQTGYGRAGTLFYYQHINVEPDLLTCAKAMANGFPIGACLVKKKIASVMKPGTHGSTYGGNPLAMSVGNAVLDIMTGIGFFDEVNRSIDYLHESLDTLQIQFPATIKEIRKVGLLIGIELYGEISVDNVIDLCQRSGLIIGKTTNINTIRLVPPIVITTAHIDQFIELFAVVLSKVAH